MSVSTNVVVMTGEEYAASGDAAFKRGVERGKHEALLETKHDITLRLHLDTAPFEASLAERVAELQKLQAKSRPTVYCYEKQRVAVEWFLPCMQVVPVSDAKFMRGISRGTFVYITGHPDHVPIDVWPHIQQDGWIVLSIDDSYARYKAAR